MKQNQKKKESKPKAQEQDELDVIKKKFDEIKDQPVTRVVKLRVKVCCGCGCDWVDIRRTVPYDLPLKDGDTIQEKDLQKGDKRW